MKSIVIFMTLIINITLHMLHTAELLHLVQHADLEQGLNNLQLIAIKFTLKH